MVVYLGLYALLFVLQCSQTILEGSALKKKRIVSFGCCFLLFVLLASRHPSMGRDLGDGMSEGYIHSFRRIAMMSWGKVFNLQEFLNYEKGYIVLNKILASISTEVQFFLGAVALISLVPIYIVVAKRSRSPIISTVVYMGLPVFLLLFSGLRQCIAIAICFCSILLIEKKRIVHFILVVLFASLFHSSALLFLLAYPIYHIRLGITVRIATMILFPIAYAVRRPMFLLLSQLFKEGAEIEQNNAFTLFVVFCFIYCFCSFFVSKDDSGYLNLFFVACLIQSMASLNSLVLRAGYYYIIPLIIFLPNTICKMKQNRWRYFCILGVVVAFFAYGLYSIYTSTWAEAYPYLFFWE